MKVKKRDFEFMLECHERDIATMLVHDYGMTIHKALDTLFNSKTYTLLQNPKTGLYFQSSRYVFSYLKDELFGQTN